MARTTKGLIHLQERNRARDYYNPLRGLDMPRLVRLIEEGERGMFGDLQWLYRTIEKRDATVKGLKARRLSELKKLDWDIQIPDKLPRGFTAKQAERQATTLRERYERIENLPQSFEALALASFRGFAHLEPHYQDNNRSLPIVRLEPVPQWHWVRHPDNWEWIYDATAESNWTMGTPIDPRSWIIRTVDDPINEIASIAFLRKNMSQKDWDAFIEDFGIPSIFGVLGENTPADMVEKWLAQMERVTGNSRGALPPGSDIKSVAFGQQGETPFKQHKDEQREEVVLAGTGGLLTMLTAATGLDGGSNADAHDAAFQALAIAEAMEISAILQTQFDKPLLATEYPGQPAVAYFELAAVDEEDRKALGELLVNLKSAGFEAEADEIAEKVNLKLTKSGAVAMPGSVPSQDPDGKKPADEKTAEDEPKPGEPKQEPEAEKPHTNRAEGQASRAGSPLDDVRERLFLAIAKEQFSEADRRRLTPLARALALLPDDATDAEWLAAFRELEEVFPQIYATVLADDPELDAVDANVIATAYRSGLEEGKQARNINPEKSP
ncbi:phage portal protein family protein [Actomonas aquatica]|uniref:DUF935 family protein n=1 Tax=Actomonas aquatica TaxID=2866162 RepID=A0ABZ1CCK4_9BACT|nr:DUF935 family protein [Opitutus sp. WL0086]WRQ89399.1 DUF935 family protein [Opitutus sp. WL0086]